MRRVYSMIGAFVLGAVGWWIGDLIGFWSAFMISTIASAVGMYAGNRIAAYYGF